MKHWSLKLILVLSLLTDYNRWYCFCDKGQILSSQDDTKSEVSSRIKISQIDPEYHSSDTKQTSISRVFHKPHFSLTTPLLINNQLKRSTSLLFNDKPGIIFRTTKTFQEADVIQTTTNEKAKDSTASKESFVANTALQQEETLPLSSTDRTVVKPSVQVEVKLSKTYQSTSQQNEASISVSEETKKQTDSKLEEEEKIERKESTAESTEDTSAHKIHADLVPDEASKDPDQLLGEKIINSAQINTDPSTLVHEKAVQTEAGMKSETTQSTHSEVMPSFDEWKKMMLAEQEKDVGHKIPLPSSVTGKKIVGHKRRHNYASYECGAKVVASNSEAEGTSHILNEMVDQYMLNPCKAKIWFVIELCESIQASQIELANFELFSSSPKEFSISWSDRFPTRDWTPLGVVIVEDQRALQSFNLQHQGYGKFIKLELLSHYGTEHYCPLSVVRVFGTSMVDEYEEMETADTHHLPDEDDDRLDIPNAEEAGSSQDIFGSARDAVINIVKKAAQALSRDNQQDATEGSRLGELLDTQSSFQAECERYLNCTDASNLTIKEKITLPVTSPFIPYLEYCDSCSLQVDNYQTHTGSASTCQFLFAALGPLVWESLCEQYKFLYEGSSSSTKAMASPDVSTTHSSLLPHYSATKSLISSTDESDKLDISYSKPSVATSRSSYSPTQSEKSHSSASSFSSSQTDYDLQKSIQPTKTLQYVSDKENSKLASKHTETFSKPLQDSATTEKIKQNDGSPLTLSERETVSASEVVDHTSEVEKSKKTVLDDSSAESTETPMLQDSKTVKPEVQDSTISVVQPIQQSSIVTPSIQDTEITKDEIERFEKEEKYENGEQSSILTKVEPVLIGTPSTPPGQKESVFMRMGNRIKALELNMSLSSQYLQELSQRYRRQMEEMQKAFNRTIGTLNDTARKAAVRDLHQREAIDQLQAQVANLTEAVDLLLHERQSAHRQMLETHLCLMIIEAIIMTTILSLCVRRMSTIPLQQKPVVGGDSSQTQPFQSYTEYSMGGSSPNRGRKRSANDSQFLAIPANYQIMEPLSPVVAEPPPKVKKKHHRNKKKSQAKLNHQINDFCSKNCYSSLLDGDINSGQSSEKTSLLLSGTSVQSIKKTVNCENSHFVQKLTERDRTRAVPLQNLTNGPVHVNSTIAVQADKFNLKKFLKLQKKHSF